MSQIIEILVSPTGQTQIQTKGFTGSSCRQASQLLERALGKTTQEHLTPEFHQQTQEQTRQSFRHP